MKIESIDLEIREDGEVLFQGKKISTRRATRGYCEVRMPLHRLIAQAFHGAPPSRLHVCHHKDGNPRNNRADNLCWITQKENTRLHFADKPRKLTTKQVRDILAKKPAPHVQLIDLARAFGVSYACVKLARAGINWKKGAAKSNRAILTAEQLKAIREWRQPVVNAAAIARKYHVSDSTILNIWSGAYRLAE